MPMNPTDAAAQPRDGDGVRVLDRTTDAFFVVDRVWRMTYLSPNAASVLKMSSADSTTQSVLWDAVPGLVGTAFEVALRKTADERIAVSVAFQGESRCWYEMRSYPAAEGIAVHMRDVSDEHAFNAERSSQMQHTDRECRIFQTALSYTPDHHSVFDLQGRLLYANPPLLKLWRKTFSEVIGRDLAELDYEPALAARLQDEIQTVIKTGQPIHNDAEYQRGAETRSYEYVLVPVFGADGLVEAVSGSSRDITDRKQSEAAREQLVRELRREQQRLNDIFDQAPCIMAVLRGPGHVIEMANAHFIEHMGDRDVIGHELREAFPEFAGQALPELLDRVYETGMGYSGREMQVMLQRTRDQPPEPRFVDFVFQPLRNADNIVTGILVQGVDLTDRKRAEERLRAGEESYRQAAIVAVSAAEANAKFRVFFEQGAQFACVLSLDGTVIEANRLCLQACGFTADDVMQKPFWQCGWWHRSPELQTRLRAAVQEAAGGRIFRQETELFTTDGTVRMIDLMLAPVTSDDGRVLFVAATGADITERERAELALRQSEVRMRSIADSAPVLLWETDLDGLTFANRQYLDFFGRPLEELKGLGWTRFIHPEDREETLRMYEEVYAQRVERVSQVRVLRHDGQYRWLLTSGYPRFDERGEFIGFVGSSSDVTDLKQAEEIQRNVAKELTRADRRKDEFLALLAHELRNPLAPLESGIQLLALAANDGSVIQRAREMMERQLRHMVRLIDDLLDISRVATGKMELRRTRVSLEDIVHSAIETAEPVITAAGHELTVSLPADPVHLLADLTRMAQVISNLLINSAKYTPEPGRIAIIGQVRDHQVSIAVTDTGIGVPREALTTIFRMFSQVDRSIERSTGGLGIGLALVKGLVELHGGTVSADSAGPNQGSTFTVNLPLITAAEEQTASEPPPRAPVVVSKHRILVVDDHRDAAMGMAAVLRSRGHEVAIANSGDSAIQQAATFRPEVILMDIGMPEMNGYEATRRIRSAAWGKTIFIIAVTGWGQEADRANSQAAGCNVHLVKPVSLPDLEVLLAGVPTSPPLTPESSPE
jgi:PAS domain S-box-containing protein